MLAHIMAEPEMPLQDEPLSPLVLDANLPAPWRLWADQVHDAAQRGACRQQRLARRGQLAGQQLALDLQSDEEEEHRHPQVVDPQQQRLGQHEEVADADLAAQLREARVGRAPGRVADDECDQRRHRQHDAAGGFGRDETTDAADQDAPSPFIECRNEPSLEPA